MIKYRITTLVLSVIVAVGAFFLMGQKGDVHFKSYEYTPEDWVTTNYTMFSTDLSNRGLRDEYCFKWQTLPRGVQLRPIIKYNYDYVVVELPDGRRGVVAPSTLSGAIREGEFKIQNYSGQTMAEKDVRRFGKIKKQPTDSTYAFVGFMTGKENYDTNKKSAYGIKPKDYGLTCIVIKHGDKYTSVKANNLWPSFATGIPVYYANHNDEFKVYVSADKLASMSKEEIDSKYGEPVSISPLPDGGKKAFYRHLRTKQGYNYDGLFINYDADGTTTVEDPRDNDNEYTLNYIKNESRPLLSRISTIDWVDLPFAFPLISMFHMNFSDITVDSNDDSFPYLWVFFGTLAVSLAFLFLIAYLMMTICFPIKSMSNGVIEVITTVVTIVPVMIIGTLYLELFQGLWIIIAIVTLVMIFVPVGLVSNETEFNRCNYCRTVDCVSHTKTLIDTKVSTRVDTYDYDDETTDYSWSGDKKTKTVIHKRDHELVETTDKKFRYDFHCSNCNKDWKSIKTESNERTLGKKTTSHGGTKTTYKKVRVE